MSKRWNKQTNRAVPNKLLDENETIEPADTEGQSHSDSEAYDPAMPTNLEGEASVSEDTSKLGMVTAQLVNVRAAPEQNANVLTLVEKGTKVQILDEEGNWYKVKLNAATHYTGYIVKDYVKVI